MRFVVETKVRIYPAAERFWYYTKRTVVRRYRLVVRRMEDGGDGLQLVEVVAGEEVAQPQQVYCDNSIVSEHNIVKDPWSHHRICSLWKSVPIFRLLTRWRFQ